MAEARPSDWCIYPLRLFSKEPKIFSISPPLKKNVHLSVEMWRAGFWGASKKARWFFRTVSRGKTMNTKRYDAGDYVKVELPDETTGVGEWVWVQVTDCDAGREFIIGNLDNEPLNDFGGRLKLGSSVVVSYAQIREHRKATDFWKR